MKESIIIDSYSKVKKKRAHLYFCLKELLYDIRNVAYIEGESRDISGSNGVDTHQIKDIAEDGNIDRVKRILDLGVSECEEALYPYTRNMLSEFGVEYRDDLPLEDSEGWVICMIVPITMSHTTLCYLEKLIHEYLVALVLYDWLSLTGRDSLAIWRDKREELMGQIKHIQNNRVSRIRLKPSPF
nr:hypothetical protein [uncultured Porphyromonas sp.]